MTIVFQNICKVLIYSTGFLLISLTGCQLAPDPYIASVIADVNETNLYNHIEKLTAIGSRFSCHENSVGSAYVSNMDAQSQKRDYVYKYLENFGYKVWQSRFTVSKLRGGEGINVIAFKEGIEDPNHVLELGAHYDTFANPGADDNCSGVAGVLEVARVLSEIPTKKSVRFCLYDLEEVDGNVGSQVHVKLLKKKAFFLKDEVFDGAIVFDGIAYAVEQKNTQQTPVRIPLLVDPPRTGNFILVVGNFKSGNLGRSFERAIDTYVKDLDYFSMNRLGGCFKDASRSDHSNYWQANLPAVMITDTGNFRNPNYHQKSDKIETLNYEFLSQVAKAAVGTLLEYAQPVTTNIKTEHEDSSRPR